MSMVGVPIVTSMLQGFLCMVRVPTITSMLQGFLCMVRVPPVTSMLQGFLCMVGVPTITSMLTIGAIAVERYLFIVHPYKHLQYISKKVREQIFENLFYNCLPWPSKGYRADQRLGDLEFVSLPCQWLLAY